MRKNSIIFDRFDLRFVKNVKSLKDSMYWSQDDLAEKLGCTRPLVGAWMEERSCPRTEIKFKICELFGIDFRTMHLIEIKNESPIGKGRHKKRVA